MVIIESERECILFQTSRFRCSFFAMTVQLDEVPFGSAREGFRLYSHPSLIPKPGIRNADNTLSLNAIFGTRVARFVFRHVTPLVIPLKQADVRVDLKVEAVPGGEWLD